MTKLVSWMLAAAFLSACSTCPAAEDDSAASVPSVSSVFPASGSAAPAAPEKSSPGSSLVDWIKYFGPLGGGGGAEHEAAYTSLARGDCRTTVQNADSISTEIDLPMVPSLKWLYGGAGSACLAALNGKSEMWARAERDYEKAKGSPIGYRCGDLEVFHMLEALVLAHRVGVTTFKKSSGKSACPRLLEFKPDHGAPTGGYAVEVIGENLPFEPFYLEWCDGRSIRAQTSNGRTFRITIPPYPDLPYCKDVHLDVALGHRVRATAVFTYDGV